MAFISQRVIGFVVALWLLAAAAEAGPIFLTGHDPDFHTQAGGGATLLTVGLNYAMNGTLNDNLHRFLWVESLLPATSGHLVGANSLPLIGLTLGQDYTIANGATFATTNLSMYTAIAVASSFGGMFTSAELNALIARSADIAAFINAGGGLFAAAECENVGNCDSSNLAAPHGGLFGYLPITVSSVVSASPFTVTLFGQSLGLTNANVNDPTHNSFNLVGGLNVVDNGSTGVPTTLAGVVTVDGGGFNSVPEPGTLSLVGLGLMGAIRRLRKRRITVS
jgi:hypothetical protein